MSKPTLVIVEETPKHIVEVRTGVMGRRGPPGEEGPRGLQGLVGPKGDPAKELEIVVTGQQLLNISGYNHGKQYLTTNNQFEQTVILLGRAEQEVDGEVRPNIGAVVLFTQGSEAALVVQTEPGIELIVPIDALPHAYGQGSSIGVIALSETKWVLVGDLGMGETIVEEPEIPED